MPELFSFDLEDGQPPILLDSESWSALRAYADAARSQTGPCGKGWVGKKPFCKRAPKGHAEKKRASVRKGVETRARNKETKREVEALGRIGQSKISPERAEQIAALRGKITRRKNEAEAKAAARSESGRKAAATRALNRKTKSEVEALGRLGRSEAPERAKQMAALRGKITRRKNEAEGKTATRSESGRKAAATRALNRKTKSEVEGLGRLGKSGASPDHAQRIQELRKARKKARAAA